MDVNMKKKGIPTAQMGRSYINRRGYKSAGVQTPKTAETPKPKLTDVDWKAKADEELEKYMRTVRGESLKASIAESNKKVAPKKKVVKRIKDEGIKVPERKMPEMKVAAPLDKTLRTGPEKRKFSDSEIKIMEIMQKGKKDDGTMKKSAQRKIQAVRTKERLATQKIRNKAERAEKRYEVKSAKDKVKAVRKSFKK
jgi:hypothetical protein